MILVFGGDGQVGRELADAAASRNQTLVAISHNEVDIAEPGPVREAIERFSPSFVVNAAAYADVERAELETDKAYRTNAEGARVLAQASHHFDTPLVHISSDFVFDGSKQAPYCETDKVQPLNVYGRTKAAGEAYVAAATDHFAIIRTSWLFGKHGRNFVKTIMSLARDRDEIRVVDDQFGNPTSARSLAAAILEIAPRLSADRTLSGIYHFTGAPVTSWHAFAADVVSAQYLSTGRAPRISGITSANFGARAKRPVNSSLDCTKLKAVLGINGTPWKDELVEIVNDILATERFNHVT